MRKRVKNTKGGVEPVKTRISEILQEEMKKQEVSIRELAERVGVTYETIRKGVQGENTPSQILLRAIAEVLRLDNVELQEIAVGDRIRKKHGTLPENLTGRNPELEPIERAWGHLSNEHKNDLIMMAQTFAKSDRIKS